jgi:hypothetical protein
MYFEPSRPTFFGCTIALLLLFSPPIVVAYFARHYIWLGVIPAGIVLLALILSSLYQKPKTVTPEQFAGQLERHLLGTEGKLDWDCVTSVPVADPRLERIRSKLAKFDALSEEKDTEELRALIARLRRGEFD